MYPLHRGGKDDNTILGSLDCDRKKASEAVNNVDAAVLLTLLGSVNEGAGDGNSRALVLSPGKFIDPKLGRIVLGRFNDGGKSADSTASYLPAIIVVIRHVILIVRVLVVIFILAEDLRD